MKKIFLILTITVVAFAMTGCFNNINTESNEEIKNTTQTNESNTAENNNTKPDEKEKNPDTSNELKAYTELLNKYKTALKEKWSGSDLNTNDMSLMMIDCYGSNPQKNIGYVLLDLDNDNSKELIIATTNAITDDFYGKLIFDVYTLNENDSPKKVLTSKERNRYYYVGENKFANLGSNSAEDTIETTVKMENGKLTDLKQTTAPSDYVQLQLTLMK